jgi:alkanesulfonate monooxygenase SsuD/methylene tetrahydromethanopterin reductase-like flavin-dependent oxidoreductase (luciferase family)
VKLCLSIEIQEGMNYAQTLALTRAAEEAGFDAALLAEHYCASSGDSDRMAADAWVFLSALARETRRIRLGTLVSPVTFRHPSVLAKLAATLDHVSEGRAELGVGAGWLEAEHAAYGFPFPAPARRVDLLEEQLEVIKGLWTQDRFTHDGAVYHLQDCHFTPEPVQQPHPRLIVGGRPTSKRLPALAAAYADEYVISLALPEECELVRQLLDRACQERGRDPDTLALSVFTYACMAETKQQVDEQLTLLMDGLRPEMRDTSRWIVGIPGEALEQLRRLETAGAHRLFLAVWHESHRDMLALLADLTARPS